MMQPTDASSGAAGTMKKQPLSAEAVSHARLAARAAELSWIHIWAEYTQDPVQIAATLANDAPIAWALAVPSQAAGGAYRFIEGTSIEGVRDQYEMLRHQLEIHGWEPLIEVRSGWYTMWSGVSHIKTVSTGLVHKGQTAVLFPVGSDGILGELQIGNVGRYPDGTAPLDSERVPVRRLDVLHEHEIYLENLRNGDADAVMTAWRDDGAMAIRSYLVDESQLLNLGGSQQIRDYFTSLFQRYQVVDIQIVNRVIDTWFLFTELYWIVEDRASGRKLEFCTADLTSIDEERKYWVSTGAGTDALEGSGQPPVARSTGSKAFVA
jgi:hypothetical protein